MKEKKVLTIEEKEKIKHRRVIVKQYLEITLGVVLAVFGFYFFFLPMNLNTGGVGGLSLVIARAVNRDWFKVGYLVYALNIILLIVAYFTLGKKFFFRTLYPTILYPTLITILEFIAPETWIMGSIPNATSQYIIGTVFGSIIVGFGLGLVLNNNSTTGGMDVVQKILTKYLRVPYSVAIYGTDGIIVLLGLSIFAVEAVLYGIIAVFILGIVVDKIIFNGRLGFTAFIITKPEYEAAIKKSIFEELDRGFTKVKVTGGFTNEDRAMIVVTIGRNQSFLLKEKVLSHDPEAFTFVVETREVVGYGFERSGE